MERIFERSPWLAPVTFALLSIVFFGGVLWTPGQVLAGEDIGALWVPWLGFAVEALRQGAFPFWDPNVFAGYPFFANIQVGLFYPPNWIYLILPVPVGLVAALMFHVWLGGWGMARLMRRLGTTWCGAGVAGIVFACSGFMAARAGAGHIGVIATLAWTPWVVLAYWWAAEAGRRQWRRIVVAGLPWALAVLAGHITSMLYVGTALAAAAVYHAAVAGEASLKRRLWCALRPLLGMVLMGLAFAAVQLVPTAEFIVQSTRTGGAFGEAARFSMPVEHLLTLAIPNLFGQEGITGYWAPGSYTEFTYYVGVLPLLLAVVALRAPALRRPALFCAALAGGGLLLALGENGALYPVISRFVPVFQLARAPARAGFLFVFGAAGLSGLAVTVLPQPETKRLPQFITPKLAMLTSGAATVVALVALLFFALRIPGSEADRLFHMGNAIFQFALWFGLSSGLLIWWQRSKHNWAPLLAAGLILLDLWGFGGGLLRTGPPPPSAMWQTLGETVGEAYADAGPFRVLPWGLSIFEQNGAALTEGVESVFGYNTMALAALNNFASYAPDPRARAYDLLNARYVVSAGQLDIDILELRYVSEFHGVYLYERPDPLPRAWLAGGYETADDPLARLNQPDFNYRTTVLLDTPPPCAPASAAGAVKFVEETPDRVTLEVSAEDSALLVYSGTFYPGWTAEVDGAPAEVLRADTLLRAVCVPAGEHTVTMRMQPLSLALGGIITALALVVLGAGVWRLLAAKTRET